MTAGRLIAVVGPSGVGKDTVISGLVAARPDLTALRRTITRPADAGGEDFDPVTPEEFARQLAAGTFALTWDAHGLRYGIPQAGLDPITAGQDVLANLSRGALDAAQAIVPRLVVLNITARPETLAARLSSRGRETTEDIAARLARTVAALPPGIDCITVPNDGPQAEAVAKALRALYPAFSPESA